MIETLYIIFNENYSNEDNSKLITASEKLNHYGKQGSNVLRISFDFRNTYQQFFIALLKMNVTQKLDIGEYGLDIYRIKVLIS